MDIHRIDYSELSNTELADLRKVLNKEYTGIGLNEILHRTVQGYVQIWRIAGIVVLTQIDQFPNGRDLTVLTIAGQMKDLRKLGTALQQLAKSLQCKWISGSALGKMEKVWEHFGAQKTNVIYRSDVI